MQLHNSQEKCNVYLFLAAAFESVGLLLRNADSALKVEEAKVTEHACMHAHALARCEAKDDSLTIIDNHWTIRQRNLLNYLILLAN